MRIKSEVEKNLGPAARAAWEKKEDEEQKMAHTMAAHEFMKKSPAARAAWESAGLNPKGGKRKSISKTKKNRRKKSQHKKKRQAKKTMRRRRK